MVETTTTLVVATRATRSNFGYNYTYGLMLHKITSGVIVAPRKKATKTMRLSINRSTVAIVIFTIVIIITTIESV